MEFLNLVITSLNEIKKIRIDIKSEKLNTKYAFKSTTKVKQFCCYLSHSCIIPMHLAFVTRIKRIVDLTVANKFEPNCYPNDF